MSIFITPFFFFFVFNPLLQSTAVVQQPFPIRLHSCDAAATAIHHTQFALPLQHPHFVHLGTTRPVTCSFRSLLQPSSRVVSGKHTRLSQLSTVTESLSYSLCLPSPHLTASVSNLASLLHFNSNSTHIRVPFYWVNSHAHQCVKPSWSRVL